MQESRYDREQLLKQALLQEGVTIPELVQALEMSEQEIFCGLYGEEAWEHIRQICQLLHIDPAYFSVRLR